MFKNYAEESGGLDLLTILGSTVGIIISMLVIWLLCIFSLYIAYKLERLRISVCPATCSGIVRPGVSV